MPGILHANASQYSVTLSGNHFSGLISLASLLTLGLSSATFAAAPSVETYFGHNDVQPQGVEVFNLGEGRGQRFFQTPLRLSERRATVNLFERYCLQDSSILEIDSGSAPVEASSLGRIKASPDSLTQICTFSSFVDYLNELASKSFLMPTSGVFTSGFGPRWSRHHSGIDIANHVGTAIQASRRGKVVFADFLGAYGLMVEIQHPDGYRTRYAHCNEILVRVGDTVAQGDLIARMGNTGRSTGPHLHFEVRSPQNIAVDPASFLGGMTIRQQV